MQNNWFLDHTFAEVLIFFFFTGDIFWLSSWNSLGLCIILGESSNLGIFVTDAPKKKSNFTKRYTILIAQVTGLKCETWYEKTKKLLVAEEWYQSAQGLAISKKYWSELVPKAVFK